jgi:RNA 3'-terminal phosphate cyclase (ATP)
MRTIDGAEGEGGGQLVRTAVALAAISGETLELHNIRMRRTPPGLAPQHVTAVQAVAALCDAEVENLQARSPVLRFRPGRLRGGHYRFDVGTAGSLTLVLQAVMRVAVMCDAPVNLVLTGGTDVRAPPPLDYLRYVILLSAAAGAGRRQRDADPAAPWLLSPWRRRDRGAGAARSTAAHPSHSAASGDGAPGYGACGESSPGISSNACKVPQRRHYPILRRSTLRRIWSRRHRHTGQAGLSCCGLRHATAFVGGSVVAERDLPAERIALNAALALRAEIDAGTTVDVHAADQILIYLALARGTSEFLVRSVSSHTATTLWLLRQFFPLDFRTTAQGGHARLVLVRP